ncbi:MAG: PKD domain-containing protein [Saprospiraceae bacterium]
MHIFRVLVFLILVAFLPKDSWALHIVGGDVTYSCLGQTNNTVRFRVTFTMYRDVIGGGAPFDNDARFGIYIGNNNNWRFVSQVIDQNVKSVTTIPIITSNPCLIAPSNVRVEKGEYQFDVALPISQNESYMIAYQRCCRNTTISNLINPGDAGAAFTVIITPFAQQTCNNSPTFNDFPPVVICNNEFINFDHSASDQDGDQLVYEFCAPLTAGGKDGTGQGSPFSCTGVTPDPINCRPPFNQVTFALPFYSFSAPLAGNPVVTINANSGIIDGKPRFSGQYVVGVCVKEFRNGQLLSIIQRDFQFNVVNCSSAVTAKIDADGWDDLNKSLRLCGENKTSFINLSTLSDRIISYDWFFDFNGTMVNYQTQDADVVFPGIGVYPGKMVLNRVLVGSENCKDSIEFVVNVFPEIKADFTFDYDTCTAGNVAFQDLSVSGAGPVQKWDWALDNTMENQQNFEYSFATPGEKAVQLIVEDGNKCLDTIQKVVSYFPVPGLIVVEPDNFVGCSPGKIFFNNLSSPIDDSYTILWDFGDGSTSDEISPEHLYELPGVYTVQVEIISPIGCSTGQVFRDWITTLEKPIANFTYSPADPNIFNNTVEFEDLSERGTGWFWEFGDLGVSYEREPNFTFRDTGVIEVKQIVRHISGCTDTAVAYIDISPITLFFFPNAFTPNGDGLNESFFPKGYFKGVQDFEMTIWNRWGEKIFSTDNPNVGWNGNKNNDLIACPPGVYIYKSSYISPRNEPVLKNGQVTLIR